MPTAPESAPAFYDRSRGPSLDGSHHLNFESSPQVHKGGDDAAARRFTYCGMTDAREPDWYLQEWAAELGKKQADLVSELGWLKNAAHRIWHGKQPYRRDILNQVARWMNIEPYELLMPPQEALSLRGMRDSAAAIVAARASGVLASTPHDHFLPKATPPSRPGGKANRAPR